MARTGEKAHSKLTVGRKFFRKKSFGRLGRRSYDTINKAPEVSGKELSFYGWE